MRPKGMSGRDFVPPTLSGCQYFLKYIKSRCNFGDKSSPFEMDVSRGKDSKWEAPGSSATEKTLGFVERHGSPHLDAAGSRIGGWGPNGKHPFLSTWDAHGGTKRRERRGRTGRGTPTASGPHPESWLLSGLAAESYSVSWSFSSAH